MIITHKSTCKKKRKAKKMLSETGIMRVTGFLFLFILATSALSGGLLAEFNVDSNQIDNTLRSIAEDPARFRASITFDLASHMAIIAIAAALYLSFNAYNRQLALFGTLWRVVEGVVMIFTEINNLVLLGVAQNFIRATGSEAVSLETLGQTLISINNWGVNVGLSFLALGALAYNILFITSKAVPRVIAWVGIVASVLGISGALLGFIIPDLLIVLTGGILIMMFYEITLGIWLLSRRKKLANSQE